MEAGFSEHRTEQYQRLHLYLKIANIAEESTGQEQIIYRCKENFKEVVRTRRSAAYFNRRGEPPLEADRSAVVHDQPGRFLEVL